MHYVNVCNQLIGTIKRGFMECSRIGWAVLPVWGEVKFKICYLQGTKRLI